MIPAVLPPKGLAGKSIDCKLKPGWRYDEARGVFVGTGGAAFAPPALPKRARIVYKVPSLARSARRGLSAAERDLQRYMQIILPTARAAKPLLAAVQSWPCFEEAHLAPEISLPSADELPIRPTTR